MAVRPATVRGGGLTGLHYGLIAFVMVTVAALGGFIFQLTKVKDAEQRAASAERRLEKFGVLPGPVGQYYETEAAARNATVAAVIGQDLAKTAQLVAGTKEAVAATLEREANELLAQIAGGKVGVINANDTLLTAIRKLDERLTREMSTSKSTSEALVDAEHKAESLTRDLKLARDTFEAQVAELKSQFERDRADFARNIAQKDDQLADIQRNLESLEQRIQTLIREGDTRVKERDLEIARLQRQIADLQKKIQDLKGSFDAEAILKKADGRILRAIPGSDVVYINLGANENAKVGMTFEVYSQTGSAERTLRGKASLEVATLMEDTAECRVTRTAPGQPIMEGDIVVNIAYEQNRQPKFVARGTFDLNFDGQPDFDGMDRITSIIRQWGGQVVPELDESVDYVVIGVAPRVGEVPPDASDIVRDQAERRQLELSEYRRLIDQARSMYIPVITQNQFLFLTGYAGDAFIRER